MHTTPFFNEGLNSTRTEYTLFWHILDDDTKKYLTHYWLVCVYYHSNLTTPPLEPVTAPVKKNFSPREGVNMQ